MSRKNLIDKMNEILRHEWTGIAQYAQASFVVMGLWREVFSKTFLDSADESFTHAKRIGEKISAYGGVPTIERNQVQQSEDLEEMIRHALTFESKAVELYTEALQLADPSDRALVVLLEDILIQEQDGVDHLELLMRQQKSTSGSSSSSSKAG